MPITQGGATLCPGLWAVALSGRAFNLKGVHSTCLRPKILRSVMVEILRDSCQNIVRIVTKKMLGSFHNIFWQLAEDHSAAHTIPRYPLSSLYKELSNGITTTVVVIPLELTKVSEVPWYGIILPSFMQKGQTPPPFGVLPLT